MRNPLRWQALAHLRGGGTFPALESLASILIQLSPRTRNYFIAIVAALVLVFALAALPAQAQATVTISGATSVAEGGLVAQQVGDCPQKARTIPVKRGNESVAAWYQRVIAFLNNQAASSGAYCEFRDNPSGSLPRVSLTVTISNADAGEYTVTREGMKIALAGTRRVTLKQGETKTIWLEAMSGDPNYTPGDTATDAVLVLPPGKSLPADAVARHEITVVDDDNTAYVGTRHHHPYGANWKREPRCYSPGCAWD